MSKHTLPELIDILAKLKDEDGEQNLRRASQIVLAKRFDNKAFIRKEVSKRWISDAWYKQKGVCSICKGRRGPLALEDAEPDHKISMAKGGKHKKSNIGAAHHVCNLEKSDKNLFEQSKHSGVLVTEQLS